MVNKLHRQQKSFLESTNGEHDDHEPHYRPYDRATLNSHSNHEFACEADVLHLVGQMDASHLKASPLLNREGTSRSSFSIKEKDGSSASRSNSIVNNISHEHTSKSLPCAPYIAELQCGSSKGSILPVSNHLNIHESSPEASKVSECEKTAMCTSGDTYKSQNILNENVLSDTGLSIDDTEKIWKSSWSVDARTGYTNKMDEAEVVCLSSSSSLSCSSVQSASNTPLFSDTPSEESRSSFINISDAVEAILSSENKGNPTNFSDALYPLINAADEDTSSPLSLAPNLRSSCSVSFKSENIHNSSALAPETQSNHHSQDFRYSQKASENENNAEFDLNKICIRGSSFSDSKDVHESLEDVVKVGDIIPSAALQEFSNENICVGAKGSSIEKCGLLTCIETVPSASCVNEGHETIGSSCLKCTATHSETEPHVDLIMSAASCEDSDKLNSSAPKSPSYPKEIEEQILVSKEYDDSSLMVRYDGEPLIHSTSAQLCAQDTLKCKLPVTGEQQQCTDYFSPKLIHDNLSFSFSASSDLSDRSDSTVSPLPLERLVENVCVLSDEENYRQSKENDEQSVAERNTKFDLELNSKLPSQCEKVSFLLNDTQCSGTAPENVCAEIKFAPKTSHVHISESPIVITDTSLQPCCSAELVSDARTLKTSVIECQDNTAIGPVDCGTHPEKEELVRPNVMTTMCSLEYPSGARCHEEGSDCSGTSALFHSFNSGEKRKDDPFKYEGHFSKKCSNHLQKFKLSQKSKDCRTKLQLNSKVKNGVNSFHKKFSNFSLGFHQNYSGKALDDHFPVKEEKCKNKPKVLDRDAISRIVLKSFESLQSVDQSYKKLSNPSMLGRLKKIEASTEIAFHSSKDQKKNLPNISNSLSCTSSTIESTLRIQNGKNNLEMEVSNVPWVKFEDFKSESIPSNKCQMANFNPLHQFKMCKPSFPFSVQLHSVNVDPKSLVRINANLEPNNEAVIMPETQLMPISDVQLSSLSIPYLISGSDTYSSLNWKRRHLLVNLTKDVLKLDFPVSVLEKYSNTNNSMLEVSICAYENPCSIKLKDHALQLHNYLFLLSHRYSPSKLQQLFHRQLEACPLPPSELCSMFKLKSDSSQSKACTLQFNACSPFHSNDCSRFLSKDCHLFQSEDCSFFQLVYTLLSEVHAKLNSPPWVKHQLHSWPHLLSNASSEICCKRAVAPENCASHPRKLLAHSRKLASMGSQKSITCSRKSVSRSRKLASMGSQKSITRSRKSVSHSQKLMAYPSKVRLPHFSVENVCSSSKLKSRDLTARSFVWKFCAHFSKSLLSLEISSDKLQGCVLRKFCSQQGSSLFKSSCSSSPFKTSVQCQTNSMILPASKATSNIPNEKSTCIREVQFQFPKEFECSIPTKSVTHALKKSESGSTMVVNSMDQKLVIQSCMPSEDYVCRTHFPANLLFEFYQLLDSSSKKYFGKILNSIINPLELMKKLEIHRHRKFDTCDAPSTFQLIICPQNAETAGKMVTSESQRTIALPISIANSEHRENTKFPLQFVTKYESINKNTSTTAFVQTFFANKLVNSSIKLGAIGGRSCANIHFSKKFKNCCDTSYGPPSVAEEIVTTLIKSCDMLNTTSGSAMASTSQMKFQDANMSAHLNGVYRNVEGCSSKCVLPSRRQIPTHELSVNNVCVSVASGTSSAESLMFDNENSVPIHIQGPSSINHLQTNMPPHMNSVSQISVKKPTLFGCNGLVGQVYHKVSPGSACGMACNGLSKDFKPEVLCKFSTDALPTASFGVQENLGSSSLQTSNAELEKVPGNDCTKSTSKAKKYLNSTFRDFASSRQKRRTKMSNKRADSTSNTELQEPAIVELNNIIDLLASRMKRERETCLIDEDANPLMPRAEKHASDLVDLSNDEPKKFGISKPQNSQVKLEKFSKPNCSLIDEPGDFVISQAESHVKELDGFLSSKNTSVSEFEEHSVDKIKILPVTQLKEITVGVPKELSVCKTKKNLMDESKSDSVDETMHPSVGVLVDLPVSVEAASPLFGNSKNSSDIETKITPVGETESTSVSKLKNSSTDKTEKFVAEANLVCETENFGVGDAKSTVVGEAISLPVDTESRSAGSAENISVVGSENLSVSDAENISVVGAENISVVGSENLSVSDAENLSVDVRNLPVHDAANLSVCVMRNMSVNERRKLTVVRENHLVGEMENLPVCQTKNISACVTTNSSIKQSKIESAPALHQELNKHEDLIATNSEIYSVKSAEILLAKKDKHDLEKSPVHQQEDFSYEELGIPFVDGLGDLAVHWSMKPVVGEQLKKISFVSNKSSSAVVERTSGCARDERSCYVPKEILHASQKAASHDTSTSLEESLDKCKRPPMHTLEKSVTCATETMPLCALKELMLCEQKQSKMAIYGEPTIDSLKTYSDKLKESSCEQHESGASKLLASGTSKLPESGTSELPESGTSELPESGTSELPESGTSELPESGASKLLASGTSKLPESGASELPESGASELPESGASKLPESGASKLPESGASELPESGASELPESGASELPESGASELPESGASELPESGASKLLASGASKLPESGASKLPESGTSELPESGTSELPASGTSELPESGTSEPPESGASRTSEATTPMKFSIASSTCSLIYKPSVSNDDASIVSRNVEFEIPTCSANTVTENCPREQYSIDSLETFPVQVCKPSDSTVKLPILAQVQSVPTCSLDSERKKTSIACSSDSLAAMNSRITVDEPREKFFHNSKMISLPHKMLQRNSHLCVPSSSLELQDICDVFSNSVIETSKNSSATLESIELAKSTMKAKSSELLVFERYSEQLMFEKASKSVVAEKPSESVVAEKPSESVVAEKPSESVVAEKPSESVVAEKPSESVVAEKPSESVASEKPSESVVAEKPSESVVAEKPSESVVAEKPSESVVAEKPSESVVAEKPSESVVAEKPSESVVAEKPSESVVAEKPSESVVAEKPSESVVAEKPSESVVAEKPSESVVAEKPSESVVAEKPSESVVAEKPSESVVAEKPSESVVAEKPSESVVAEKPSESVVAEKPSESVVAEKPSESVVAENASELMVAEPTSNIQMTEEGAGELENSVLHRKQEVLPNMQVVESEKETNTLRNIIIEPDNLYKMLVPSNLLINDSCSEGSFNDTLKVKPSECSKNFSRAQRLTASLFVPPQPGTFRTRRTMVYGFKQDRRIVEMTGENHCVQLEEAITSHLKSAFNRAGKCNLCDSNVRSVANHVEEVHICLSFRPLSSTSAFYHHTLERYMDFPARYSDSMYGNPYYLCGACDFWTKSMDRAWAHTQEHLQVFQVNECKNDQRMCACSVPLYSYKLHHWQKTLKSSLLCHLCGSRFRCDEGLKIHLRSVHTLGSVCNPCGMVLTCSPFQHNIEHLESLDSSRVPTLPRISLSNISFNIVDNLINYLDGRCFRISFNSDDPDRSQVLLPLYNVPEDFVVDKKFLNPVGRDLNKHKKNKCAVKVPGNRYSVNFDVPIQILLQKKCSLFQRGRKIFSVSRPTVKEDDLFSVLGLKQVRSSSSTRKKLRTPQDFAQCEDRQNSAGVPKVMLSSALDDSRDTRDEQDNNVEHSCNIRGEWYKDHIFVCCACGTVEDDLAEIMDHKWAKHTGVLCAHTMIANKDTVPVQFCQQYMPPVQRQVLSGITTNCCVTKSMKHKPVPACSKCKTEFPSNAELHAHMVECGSLFLMEASKYLKKSKKNSRFHRRRGQGISRRLSGQSSNASNMSKEVGSAKNYEPSTTSVIKRRLEGAVQSIDNRLLKKRLTDIIRVNSCPSRLRSTAASSRRCCRMKLRRKSNVEDHSNRVTRSTEKKSLFARSGVQLTKVEQGNEGRNTEQLAKALNDEEELHDSTTPSQRKRRNVRQPNKSRLSFLKSSIQKDSEEIEVETDSSVKSSGGGETKSNKILYRKKHAIVPNRYLHKNSVLHNSERLLRRNRKGTISRVNQIEPVARLNVFNSRSKQILNSKLTSSERSKTKFRTSLNDGSAFRKKGFSYQLKDSSSSPTSRSCSPVRRKKWHNLSTTFNTELPVQVSRKKIYHPRRILSDESDGPDSDCGPSETRERRFGRCRRSHPSNLCHKLSKCLRDRKATRISSDDASSGSSDEIELSSIKKRGDADPNNCSIVSSRGPGNDLGSSMNQNDTQVISAASKKWRRILRPPVDLFEISDDSSNTNREESESKLLHPNACSRSRKVAKKCTSVAHKNSNVSMDTHNKPSESPCPTKLSRSSSINSTESISSRLVKQQSDKELRRDSDNITRNVRSSGRLQDTRGKFAHSGGKIRRRSALISNQLSKTVLQNEMSLPDGESVPTRSKSEGTFLKTKVIEKGKAITAHEKLPNGSLASRGCKSTRKMLKRKVDDDDDSQPAPSSKTNRSCSRMSPFLQDVQSTEWKTEISVHNDKELSDKSKNTFRSDDVHPSGLLEPATLEHLKHSEVDSGILLDDLNSSLSVKEESQVAPPKEKFQKSFQSSHQNRRLSGEDKQSTQRRVKPEIKREEKCKLGHSRSILSISTQSCVSESRLTLETTDNIARKRIIRKRSISSDRLACVSSKKRRLSVNNLNFADSDASAGSRTHGSNNSVDYNDHELTDRLPAKCSSSKSTIRPPVKKKVQNNRSSDQCPVSKKNAGSELQKSKTRHKKNSSAKQKLNCANVPEFACRECGLQFDSSKSYLSHDRDDCANIVYGMGLMADDKLYECPHCHLTFAYKSTQKKHSSSCRSSRTRKPPKQHLLDASVQLSQQPILDTISDKIELTSGGSEVALKDSTARKSDVEVTTFRKPLTTSHLDTFQINSCDTSTENGVSENPERLVTEEKESKNISKKRKALSSFSVPETDSCGDISEGQSLSVKKPKKMSERPCSSEAKLRILKRRNNGKKMEHGQHSLTMDVQNSPSCEHVGQTSEPRDSSDLVADSSTKHTSTTEVSSVSVDVDPCLTSVSTAMKSKEAFVSVPTQAAESTNSFFSGSMCGLISGEIKNSGKKSSFPAESVTSQSLNSELTGALADVGNVLEENCSKEPSMLEITALMLQYRLSPNQVRDALLASCPSGGDEQLSGNTSCQNVRRDSLSDSSRISTGKEGTVQPLQVWLPYQPLVEESLPVVTVSPCTWCAVLQDLVNQPHLQALHLLLIKTARMQKEREQQATRANSHYRYLSLDSSREELLKSVSSLEEIIKQIADIKMDLSRREMLFAMKETFEATIL